MSETKAMLPDPFADEGPDIVDEAPAPVTVSQAREMGFSEDELSALFAAGVLVDERRAGQWRPENLDDLDWLLAKRKQLAAEKDELVRWHTAALVRLAAAEIALDRFDADCLQVLRDNLPLKKDGSPAKKSLILQHGKAKVVSSAGGPRVVDQTAILAHLRELIEVDARAAYETLLPALRVEVRETHTGADALEMLDAIEESETIKLVTKVLHAEVKAYVESLPPNADRYTGEVFGPATIPGVEIAAPSERIGYE